MLLRSPDLMPNFTAEMSKDMPDNKQNIITIFSEYFENTKFSKLTLSSVISKNNEFKTVFIKPIQLKDGLRLSFLYRYPTKDITKNHTLEESVVILNDLIGKVFLQADLFTLDASYHFLSNKKGHSKLTKKEISEERILNLDHNKAKTRLIGDTNNAYLKILGIMTEEGKIRNDKQDKFRQINKYIEFFSQALKESAVTSQASVVDMGSGKGYLTFAMYDYLTKTFEDESKVLGVEFREDMVMLCNKMAQSVGFNNLTFEKGTIETAVLPDFNILIALHACDTATDEAIFRGITNHAEIILVSPCCHKQIRKQYKPSAELKTLGKFGIIEERQSEIITDTIRALILEAYGYKTKIFEFISTEHTPKNLMISAVRKADHKKTDEEKLKEVQILKNNFGIKEHHLETLLKI